MRKSGSECKNYVKEIIPDFEQTFQGEFEKKGSFSMRKIEQKMVIDMQNQTYLAAPVLCKVNVKCLSICRNNQPMLTSIQITLFCAAGWCVNWAAYRSSNL
jgi:hypothetical protein